jgi:CPA1 family monovalent cation:H+ antiporter
VLLAFVAVLTARAIAVFGPLPFLRHIEQPLDHKSAIVLWWGGLRGGLSMVLVLSLPADVAAREALIAMTFGVVLLSVVLQGSTMSFLLARLKLVPAKSEAMRFLSQRLARLRAVEAQQDAIHDIIQEDVRSLPGLREIEKELDVERERIIGDLSRRAEEPAFVEAATARASALREHLREVARDSYREARDENLIDEEDAAELIATIDEDVTTK